MDTHNVTNVLILFLIWPWALGLSNAVIEIIHVFHKKKRGSNGQNLEKIFGKSLKAQIPKLDFGSH